jgi:hypothetical protein
MASVDTVSTNGHSYHLAYYFIYDSSLDIYLCVSYFSIKVRIYNHFLHISQHVASKLWWQGMN